MKKTFVAVVAVALLMSPVANAKTNKRQAAERCITSEADAVFEALRPLTKSCSRVGPASARWYVSGSVWNGLSHDQQRQLMDEVASKQAIHDARVTIHIYAYSTDVGEIGPGWTGEWKFRRNDD